jgi:hypothetical protein
MAKQRNEETTSGVYEVLDELEAVLKASDPAKRENLVNDLTAPLGQGPRSRRRAIKIPLAQIILAAALGVFLGLVLLWAVVADDPSAGEPMAVVPADLHAAAIGSQLIAVPQESTPADSPHDARVAAAKPASADGTSPKTVTVTIVDGKTGAKQEVVVPAPARPAASGGTRPDQKSLEVTPPDPAANQ